MAAENAKAWESFPTTHWSLVDRAARGGAAGQREALDELLARYLPALKAHMMRKMRLPEDRAQDLLQDFVAEKVLEREILAKADQARGRFRTFLLTACQNFAISTFRKEKARKRAAADGASVGIENEDERLRVAEANTDVYDVEWAREVLREALRRMRVRCEGSGREDLWGLFETRFLDPLLEQAEPPAYDELVGRFGFRSPNHAAKGLMRAKRMFGRQLRAVVGEYCESRIEVDDEIRALRQILATAEA